MESALAGSPTRHRRAPVPQPADDEAAGTTRTADGAADGTGAATDGPLRPRETLLPSPPPQRRSL